MSPFPIFKVICEQESASQEACGGATAVIPLSTCVKGSASKKGTNWDMGK